MSKTIKEWFEELPSGYRELALKNIDDGYADWETGSARGAIRLGTAWSQSEEGSHFWMEVFDRLERGGELPPLPSSSSKQTELVADTNSSPLFPEDADERKTFPVGTFISDYFPHAIAALAKHSYEAQQQHGDPANGAVMQWLKDKSVGDGNQIIRHYMEGDYTSTAWRALELLERELTK